jgi:MFS family permease
VVSARPDVPGVARPSRGPAADVSAAVAASTAGALPVFLVGTLAVQIRGSLHFGPGALGAAVAVYYLGAACGSIPLGRLAEAVGGIRVMRVSTLCAAVVLGLLAVLSRSWGLLTGWLFLAGTVSAAIQPATNLFLSRRIPRQRQGLAFGVKQATVPLAALLSGLAVPAIALSIGWRWAFAFAAVLALAAAGVIPRPRTTLTDYRANRPDAVSPGTRLALGALAVGFGLGVFAATGLSTFLVTSAVATGFSKADAGLLAALASGTALGSRVASGLLADRRSGRHLLVVAAMLGSGVAGYVCLGVASSARLTWLFGAGAVLAYGAGWGWNGLFALAIIRSHPDSPARATAVTQVGGRIAGAAGPLVFGLLVTHNSYTTGWLADGAAALAGAGVIIAGRTLLIRALERADYDRRRPR